MPKGRKMVKENIQNNHIEMNGTSSDNNRKRRRDSSDDDNSEIDKKRRDNKESPKKIGPNKRKHSGSDSNSSTKRHKSDKRYSWQLLPGNKKLESVNDVVISSYNFDKYTNDLRTAIAESDFIRYFILDITSFNPDVICLRKVQAIYFEKLSEQLTELNYSISLTPDTDESMNLIVYNQKNFKCIDYESKTCTELAHNHLSWIYKPINIEEKSIKASQFYQIMILEPLNTKIRPLKNIIIGNIRLSDADPLNHMQICAFLSRVNDKRLDFSNYETPSANYGDVVNTAAAESSDSVSQSSTDSNHKSIKQKVETPSEITSYSKFNCNVNNSTPVLNGIYSSAETSHDQSLTTDSGYLVCAELNSSSLKQLATFGYPNTETINLLRTPTESLYVKYHKAFFHTLQELNSFAYKMNRADYFTDMVYNQLTFRPCSHLEISDYNIDDDDNFANNFTPTAPPLMCRFRLVDRRD